MFLAERMPKNRELLQVLKMRGLSFRVATLLRNYKQLEV